MEKLIINGGKKLSGKVKVESAKNSVLPILAATVMMDSGQTLIKNCPKIADVLNMIAILNDLGLDAKFIGDDLMVSGHANKYSVDAKLGGLLRSSVLLTGALISAVGKAEMPYPGGCKIGVRPINIHVEVLKGIGVEITDVDNGFFCSANTLKGGTVKLAFPSVGATENVILASAKCNGVVTIVNCAKEPEIVDLANFLNACGAKIKGAGTEVVVIEGVKKLRGVEYLPVFDRIEAGTFIVASLVTGGEIEISNVNQKIISSFIGKICNNTCNYIQRDDIIYVKSRGVLNPYDICTGPYPEFPTDMQPQMTVLCCTARGQSVIKETVFEMRFGHVSELKKMGANVKVNGKQIIINPSSLNGAKVYAHDLRCGAALILAGLYAQGQTTVCGMNYVERGYLNIDKKLLSLGADVLGK